METTPLFGSMFINDGIELRAPSKGVPSPQKSSAPAGTMSVKSGPAPSQGAPKSVERKAAECAENVFNVPLCRQHQDSPHIQNNDTKIKSRTMWRSSASGTLRKPAGICNILITADEYIVSVFGIIVNSPLASSGKRRAHRQHKKGSMPLMRRRLTFRGSLMGPVMRKVF